MTESRQLSDNFKDRLLEILLEIPALRNENIRNRLLHGLPPGPASTIPRNAAWEIDLHNILEAVKGWEKLESGEFNHYQFLLT